MAAPLFPHGNPNFEMTFSALYTKGMQKQYELSATNVNNLLTALNGANPNQIGQGTLMEAQLAMNVFSITVLLISNSLANLGSTYKAIVNNIK